MFTTLEKEKALKMYEEIGKVTAVIQKLGYPTRETLYNWLREKQNPKEKEKVVRKRINNSPEHPLHPTPELKLETIRRCFEVGENVKLVTEEIGYSRSTIYQWRRRYEKEGATAFMGHNDIKRAKLEEPLGGTSKELKEMLEQMRQMQMQIDILNEAVKILKKDRGVELKNREKVAIVDALKKKYKLPELLASVLLPKSSYYYIKQNKADKYCDLRQKIIELFEENKSRYGYRRIHALLVKERIRVSEKIVRRLMREEKLEVKIKRTRKYYSYKGEITPAPANVIARDFHAEKPNEKWLSDLTEFAIPAGKVYLSPMVDCFDGYICAWTIGKNPNVDLVNKMLVQAIGTLKDDERPIIHTDRGCHYRWDGWIARKKIC